MERSDRIRKSVEWDEGGFVIPPDKEFEVQAHHVAKGAETTGYLCICACDGQEMVNGNTVGVVGGGVPRIWKCLHPRCKGV